MLLDHFPLLGLRLTTPRLTLRLPSEEQLAALADLAAEGVHDPDVMPFAVPWTDAPPAERARAVVQYHWSQLAGVQPADWSLPLVVLRRGDVPGPEGPGAEGPGAEGPGAEGPGAGVLGKQDMSARDFAVRREVATGSWLGLRHQRQGYGVEMRAAVLHLAFAGLGAEEASSGAYDYNAASLSVSRKLGYADDGIERTVIRGAAATQRRLRLTRAAWEAHRSVPVTMEGLDACRPMLGADAGA
jgi:RimJ/RimL family protein N-acetyltransferase